MKKIFKTLTVTFLASIILICCKKDDEKSNFLRVDDSRFRLASGSLINYGTGSGEEGCLYYMYLVSSGIEINEFGVLSSGSGQLIKIRFISSSLIGLETGEYVFDKTSSPLPFLSFSALHSLNWTYGMMNLATNVVSGVVKVVNNNDNYYEISIDCEDLNGDEVTGYYKGLLIYSQKISVE